MRTQIRLSIVAATTLVFAMLAGASAQTNNPKYQVQTQTTGKNGVVPRFNRAARQPSSNRVFTPANTRFAQPSGGNGGFRGPGGYRGPDGYRGPGNYGGYYGGYGRPRFGGFGVPVIITAIPGVMPPNAAISDSDDSNFPPSGRRTPQSAVRRGPSGAPPANETRMVPDEVVIEIANSVTPQTIDTLQRRFRLMQIESQSSQLTRTTLYRWRIPDHRSVATVVRALEGNAVVGSAQPNYLFTIQQTEAKASTEAVAEGDPAQYELAKLRLLEAHTIAKGGEVLVAVIDSGVDASHPELIGAIAKTFDAVDSPAAAHKHGTAIAGLIAAHGKLMGSAPTARILAIRAFDPKDASAQGSTFAILKGLDWAVANGARIINMSFAGPADPAMHRCLEAARKNGIVLIAAAGNAGAKSPPLYPAADPNVIAVTATDADDKLVQQSNRGRHIAIAAPGAQILVAIPDGGYEVSSGTSYSAAEVSGIVALMIERKPDLTPDKVRVILQATARDLGPKGPDIMFGAGLADAYAAISSDSLSALSAVPRPISHVSAGTR